LEIYLDKVFILDLDGLKLVILLPLPPECWNYRHILPYLAPQKFYATFSYFLFL
jgi:hypothetical protein